MADRPDDRGTQCDPAPHERVDVSLSYEHTPRAIRVGLFMAGLVGTSAACVLLILLLFAANIGALWVPLGMLFVIWLAVFLFMGEPEARYKRVFVSPGRIDLVVGSLTMSFTRDDWDLDLPIRQGFFGRWFHRRLRLTHRHSTKIKRLTISTHRAAALEALWTHDPVPGASESPER